VISPPSNFGPRVPQPRVPYAGPRVPKPPQPTTLPKQFAKANALKRRVYRGAVQGFNRNRHIATVNSSGEV
jgi:hypothetical protein